MPIRDEGSHREILLTRIWGVALGMQIPSYSAGLWEGSHSDYCVLGVIFPSFSDAVLFPRRQALS